jgi:Cu-processing system permease protein
MAQRELRDALRNRWFALFAVAFAALSLALSYMALAGSGTVGFAGFGRTAASLINLVLLIVPLMALTIGGMSIASERERGTLAYLLAQPVTRADVFVGKYVGLGLGLLAALALGFGLSGLVMAARGGGTDVRAYLLLVGLALMLGLVMLSIGLLVSVFVRKTSVALGLSLFLWLLFVFVGDLGMMGTSIVLRLPVDSLLALAAANPLQVFKMAAVLSINASLDVLGPAGIYASQRYGPALLAAFVAALAAWAAVPAAVAYLRFRLTGDV